MIDNSLHQLALDVLSNADIVEVISSRIKVIKAGRGYKAVCPFHDDKNPSLMISQEKQIFKCFVCGASGNAISFIQKFDKVSFFEAMKEVAKISGYNDDRLEKQVVQKSNVSPELKEVYDCLTAINNFYMTSLFQSDFGRKGLDYLHERGLDDETLRYFNVGYSLDDGNNIINYLKANKFSIKTIERTGIGHINISNMSIKDNNAGRVIFPLISKDGQILGFSARRINNNDDSAKYINTESTVAFNKGMILYNLHNAKNAIKETKYVYLLEGFMDVIALYRANIKSAIALMGTALTKDQIRELKYLNCEVRICLDLDSAGQNNTHSIINKLEEAGIEYKIVNNQVDFKEKDSDEILTKHGVDALKKYLFNLVDSGEWLLNYYSKSLNLNNSNDKKKLVKLIMPYVAKLNSKFDVETFINKISYVTGFSKPLLYEYLDKYKKSIEIDDNELFVQNIINSNKKITKLDLAQFKIVKYMLENTEAIQKVNEYSLYFPTLKYRDIANMLYEYINSIPIENKNISVEDVMNFVSLNMNLESKDKIINDISDIALNDEIRIPPYSADELSKSIENLNKIRNHKRFEQAVKDLDKGLDPVKRAEVIQALIEKRKRK